MKLKEIINQTERFLKNIFENESTGHDWYHLDRVRKLALYIYTHENKGERFIIEMSALFHDFLDDKIQSTPEIARRKLHLFLSSQNIPDKDIEKIVTTIAAISFKGGNESPLPSFEAKIVRDADRLDAIGAIGIARAFHYGGAKVQRIYEPNLQVRKEMTVEEYRNGQTSTINHFYEKLLKLKDSMQTDTGRLLAEKRHQFLESFLKQFFEEWNGDE